VRHDPATTDGDASLTLDDTGAPTGETTDTLLPPPDDDCRPFVPCGGSLVALWTIDDACSLGGSNPYLDICPTATLVDDVRIDGTVELADDHTYTFAYSGVTVTTLTFPFECNDAIAACSAYDGLTGMSCTGEPHVTCTCSQTSNPYELTASGDWSRAGDAVVFADLYGEGPSGSATMDTCQQANQLTLRRDDHLFAVQFDLSR
jgi:hypothetical protein